MPRDPYSVRFAEPWFISEGASLSILFALPLTLLAPVAAANAAPDGAILDAPTAGTITRDLLPEDRREWRQVIIEQRIIIRIPARSRASAFQPASPNDQQSKPGPTIVWREAKAPKCLRIASLLGVQVTRDDSIDLLTDERQRLRARLDEDCRTLDFYSGFYVERTDDGMVCADRDVIQARSGARCEIDEFRLMVPVTLRD